MFQKNCHFVASKRAITIYYCGQEACEPKHSFGPAIRPHYLIHFVLKGKGIYRTGGQEYQVEAGQAFLIKPGEITYYEASAENPWEYVWIAFDGEEAERLLKEYDLLEQGYIATLEKREGTQEYIRRVGELFVEGEQKQNEVLGYFYLIFSSIIREEKEVYVHFDRGYLKIAEDYIRHNYSYDIRISDVAKYVGVERTYLYKIFMKYKNQSPKQYLTEFRIMVAKDMLGNTELSVTEIGLSCGFHDSSVFCKNFAKAVKNSPLQYRKMMKI